MTDSRNSSKRFGNERVDRKTFHKCQWTYGMVWKCIWKGNFRLVIRFWITILVLWRISRGVSPHFCESASKISRFTFGKVLFSLTSWKCWRVYSRTRTLLFWFEWKAILLGIRQGVLVYNGWRRRILFFIWRRRWIFQTFY